MARMHSKKKGKAKSRKPAAEEIRLPEGHPGKKEIEELIIGYAKQGMGPALIGETLKRKHNIPYIKYSLERPLTKFLEERGVSTPVPSDMLDLMRKAVNLYGHLATNKQDVDNRIRLHKIESKIWRLTKYYIREGVLPANWRYDHKQAELLIKGAS